MSPKFSLSLLFICIVSLVLAQSPDSTPGIPEPDEEFNLFLFMFAAGAISLMAGVFVISILIALLCLAVFSGLVFLGVFSASALIGYHKRSFKKGFYSFVVIAASISSAFIGMLLFIVIAHLFKIETSSSTALITGFIAGASGGFLSGKLIVKLCDVVILGLSKRIQKF